MSAEAAPAQPLFGTDGIRAPAGQYPLEERTVSLLGLRLAELLRRRSRLPRVVLGGDTRESTPSIGSWLAGGLEAGGAEWSWAGVLPTPGVAWLVSDLDADCGIVISASHNPPRDNGIKLLDRGGGKWATAAERELERALAEPGSSGPPPALEEDPEPAARYLDALATQLPGEAPLAGLSIVLDAANGAASGHAGRLFRRLGADVRVLFDRPTGRNINLDCGSTHPQHMARATVETASHLGCAFDGDADRVIWADERGRVRDGDDLLYLWATTLHRDGLLDPPRIVATSMSNLGLEKALAAEGIGVERCDVGDRAVADTMHREGIQLGGEQSGHIIYRRLSATGDGLQTAIHLAALAARTRRPLSELASPFRRFPQTLINVAVRDKPDLATLPRVAAAKRSVERRLGDSGRLVLRYSGTEPLARVMVEAEERTLVETLASELAETIREELGDV